ncbi:MAG: peptide chain release factor 2 [Planctomycetes bacterium]|nr:peptide chain release factor 2 [Planctomycetota bacterium]
MVDLPEIRSELVNIQALLKGLNHTLGLDSLRDRIVEIEGIMSAQDFWNSNQAAQTVIEELKSLKTVVTPLEEASAALEDLKQLLELAEEEKDPETLNEVKTELASLRVRLEELEVRALLSGPHDDNNAFFSVHAGAGGNDACECAEIILRMYLRFFERQGWKAEELTWIPGEEAGLRGATYRLRGDHVYGYMRSEIGVHRIVRISPFSGRRETSFVGVDVVPEYDDINIEIDEAELRIDTFRSSGKGGQHVNKTDSAVRITHLPTGAVVSVQNERSQHKNKALALKLLKAKLHHLEEVKREQEQDNLYNEKGDIAFGSQIRNYVFQPYTQVKDARTGHEVGDIQRVIDGDLYGFVEAYLRWDVARRQD